MKHVRIALILALSFLALTAAENTDASAWELAMHANRPYLPPRESMTLKTLKASVFVRNGDPRDEARAVAERTLGLSFAEEASWRTTFRTADERIDVAEHVSSTGAHSRFAVYGQYGNHVPYYWIADGLAASGQTDVAAFLKANGIVGGTSSVFAADGVFAADETTIAGRGEKIAVPYARFRFAFVDDHPGANWAHPCRYVFISEDFTSFTVLYKRWMPRLSVRATGDGIWLQKVAEGTAPNAKAPNAQKLDAVKNSVYGYARSLVSNGLSYRAGDRSRSYFMLIGGGSNPYLNGIRFWSDIAMMYSTLTLKYSVPKDNIYVYMSDGVSRGEDANLDDGRYALVDSPWDLDGDNKADIAGAATKANVSTCLASLRARLTVVDQLFVFITGHGDAVGTPGPNNYNCSVDMFTMEEDGYYYKDAEQITDKELASWTRGFACPVAFAIEPCYSGGFIDDLVATPNRVVATACNHYEQSYGTSGDGSWWNSYGETCAYNYWSAPFIAAFRGCRAYSYGDWGYPWKDQSYYSVNADSNGDGKVSFAEARIYAYDNDTLRCTSPTHPQWCSYVDGENAKEHPQYGENPRGLGASFFLLKPGGQTAPVLFAGTKAETPFAGDATYVGWVRDKDGALAGVLTVKAGKAAPGGKAKLAVTYMPMGGKKQTIKLANDALPEAGKVATVKLPGIGTVKLTGDMIEGVDVDVQAGTDLLKSKDKEEKTKATAAAASKAGTWTFALGTGAGYAAFTVTVDKKGKGKLAGTLPDGTKVAVSSPGVLGDGVLAIPFAYAKKGALGFVFWVKGSGTAELSDLTKVKLPNGKGYAATPVAPSATHRLADGNHTFAAGGVSQAFSVAGQQWNVPKQDKKASPDPNPTGLKLKFTERTGTVKGTFMVVDGKAKTKYTVVGTVVGGRFYGAAYVRNAGSFSATAR
ncbi:MAG: hypothetical protein IJI36_03240 [Kiritimatiellae bacterium]|nr:hypothetical protein [Kiritimatiellia bacterium]